MLKRQYNVGALLFCLVVSWSTTAGAAEPLKVLSGGAFKQVLLAVLPQFEKNGQTVQVDTDTVGSLVRRIEAGESFDLVIASPAALDGLRKSGKITHENFDLARVGVGVGIKDGAPKPDIGTVDGFKRTLQSAKAVAYIDPASGGTSGIYIAGLVDKLGIGAEVKAKSVLVHGGFAAERLTTGEADIALQQISEILPVKGAVLAGPLPAEIQNYTTYSAGVSSTSKQVAAAQSLIDWMRTKQSGEVMSSKGMEPIR